MKKLLEKQAAAKLAAVAAWEATSVELVGQGAAFSMQPLADAGVVLPPLPSPALEQEEVIVKFGSIPFLQKWTGPGRLDGLLAYSSPLY